MENWVSWYQNWILPNDGYSFQQGISNCPFIYHCYHWVIHYKISKLTMNHDILIKYWIIKYKMDNWVSGYQNWILPNQPNHGYMIIHYYHYYPLSSITIHCYPLLSIIIIVIHYYPLLSIIIHHFKSIRSPDILPQAIVIEDRCQAHAVPW